jgi:alpha-D-ribose 1-methylphosphonate 5-triphosphate diphosphatase
MCLPGLIDLHCDALEKEVEPRPKVAFDHAFALANSDRRNLNAGITTVYHAISFASREWGVRDPRIATAVVREVREFRGLIEHKVHARFEVTDDGSEEPLSELLREGQLELLSFMDHSPGQGQFGDLAAYVTYMTRTYHVSEAEAVAIGSVKVAARSQGPGRMHRLAALARAHGIALAEAREFRTPAPVRNHGLLSL